MLEIKNLNIEIGLKIIIKDLSFVVTQNDKLAIIGEEGNGKTTLLKAISENLDYAKVTGIIKTNGNKIGYLEQSLNTNKTPYDYLFESVNDYYNKINALYKYLKILNMDYSLIERDSIKNFSGGEKVKLQLLKLLLDEVDILLLDEPSNDLDIDTLKWLEDFINNCNKPIIYISHDETLLSNTANMILHLELRKKKTECFHTILKTSYDEYVNNRLKMIDKTIQIANKEKENYKKQMEKFKQIMNKVEHQQNTISRKDPHGAKMLKKKMKSIKSQEKRINSQDFTEIPDVEEAINIFFEEVKIPKNKIILDYSLDLLKINDLILARDINLKVSALEKIVIVGTNGIGKSTLIKLIYENLKNRDDIKVGYMPQDYEVILNRFDNPIDFVCSENNKPVDLVRSFMGNAKFTREEMTGSINDLSGGSKAKLFLIKLILDEVNVLILDEPTRNVSPLSNPIIRSSLKDFGGSIISVSHDRKYIEEVSSQIYELTELGIKKIYF